MPPDMSISMRHTKLKAEEAALLAGEVSKPSWESRNEGIHERISFEDAIWGFDLAGGAYYKTPLRVTAVKPDSRAEKAGIRPGDRLLRINDVDTSTLTIQEAHRIIIDSGIHLRLAVTAPEDEEDSYHCYEDPLDYGYDSEEERRIEEEKARKREVHAKVSSYWSLQWPWVSKRRVIYRESNCFMVPSKYEDKHKDRFSPQPIIRTQDDIVLYSAKNENSNKTSQKPIEKRETQNQRAKSETDKVASENTNQVKNKLTNGFVEDTRTLNGNLDQISEVEEESSSIEEINSQSEEMGDESISSHTDDVTSSKDDEVINEVLIGGEDSVSTAEEDKVLNGILSDEVNVNNNDTIER